MTGGYARFLILKDLPEWQVALLGILQILQNIAY
jgi:hypothetical protein